MKHWVIVLAWANNGENGLQIIAVEHSFEAAQQHFQKAVEDERKIADGNNWQVSKMIIRHLMPARTVSIYRVIRQCVLLKFEN